MEFLFVFFGLLASMATGAGVWFVRSGKSSDKFEDTPLHSAGHYKRVQREKDFKEWNNEYISILRGAFLEKYKIPYNEAQLAYIAYNNYASSKKAIDDIGDRAYWFDDCPSTQIVNRSVTAGMIRTTDLGGVVPRKNPFTVPDNVFFGLGVEDTYRSTTIDGTSVVEHFPRRYDTSYLSANMITANKIYAGTPGCSCESCDFNAKLDTYNRMKSIWDHTKEQLSIKYPEFVFENLPKELPELSV